MKKVFLATALSLLFLGQSALAQKAQECLKNGVKYGVTKGSFRAEWWNYQERATSYLDGECYAPALSDIEEAVKIRTALVKKDCDQRRARTYGMHFVDYFGHRGRGVALYNLGRLDEAQKELELSLSCVESNQAQYYLDLIRKSNLEKTGWDKTPPSLELTDPKDKSYLNQAEVQLRGKAWDDSFVKEIWVGMDSLPIPISEKEISFQEQMELQPGWNNFKIRVVDLTGKETGKDYSLYLDQQGPEVNILEIKQISGPEIEVIGQVQDDGGIAKLTLNNKEVSIENGKSFQIKLNVASDWKIWFKAIDRAGNQTEGMINLNSEPKGAMLETPPPYREASLDGDWQTYPSLPYQTLSFRMMELGEAEAQVAFTEMYWDLKKKYENYTDTEPPLIKLKGLRTEQTVYFPEIYLEGLVTDQNQITELTINGKKVGRAQSKNIFFNQILPLSPGANKILIRAKDPNGNVAEKTLRIFRVTPAVHTMESRMVVSMLPFYQSGQIQEIGSVAYDNLISAIVGQKRFHFVDRAKVEAIVRELKLSAEQLVDPAYTLKVGKMTASEAMIIGSVKEAPNSIEVYAQLLDVESGEVLAEKDAFNRDKSLESLKYLSRGLAIRLREEFPLLEGKVIKMDGKNAVLDLGSSQKMKPGMRVIFFAEKEMTDAETGMKLGYTTDQVGMGKIITVSDRMSTAEPVGKSGAVSSQEKVITK